MIELSLQNLLQCKQKEMLLYADEKLHRCSQGGIGKLHIWGENKIWDALYTYIMYKSMHKLHLPYIMCRKKYVHTQLSSYL
jgi:hypothetical protein